MLRGGGGGGITEGTTPIAGGTDKQVQFNDGGLINGTAGLTFAKANNTLGIGSNGWVIFGTGSTNSALMGRSNIDGNQGFVMGSSATLSWAAVAADGSNSDTFLSRFGAASLQLGKSDAAAPVAQTLGVQNVVAGNANTAAANFTIRGGLSNGSGGGDVLLQTTLSNAASGSQNTAATAITLKGGTQNVQVATTISTPTVASFSGTTGTVTFNVATSNFFTNTPSGAITLNTTGTQVAGTHYYIVFTTSGTSSFVVTFNTGFKTTGTLTTGTSSGKVFVLHFISDGTNLNEVSRTTAM